jgi:membrane associated rhomboid family serine protease
LTTNWGSDSSTFLRPWRVVRGDVAYCVTISLGVAFLLLLAVIATHRPSSHPGGLTFVRLALIYAVGGVGVGATVGVLRPISRILWGRILIGGFLGIMVFCFVQWQLSYSENSMNSGPFWVAALIGALMGIVLALYTWARDHNNRL